MKKFDADLNEERWRYWVSLPAWCASDAIFILMGMEPDAVDWADRRMGPIVKAGFKNSAVENHFRRVGLIEQWPFLTNAHPPKSWIEEFLKIPGEALPFPLPTDLSLDATGTAEKIQNCGAWPWGSHETQLLRNLAEAADRFWSRYDPTDNTTAPTNQQVITWLKERGVAERTAEVMATILRADGLPTGPRK